MRPHATVFVAAFLLLILHVDGANARDDKSKPAKMLATVKGRVNVDDEVAESLTLMLLNEYGTVLRTSQLDITKHFDLAVAVPKPENAEHGIKLKVRLVLSRLPPAFSALATMSSLEATVVAKPSSSVPFLFESSVPDSALSVVCTKSDVPTLEGAVSGSLMSALITLSCIVLAALGKKHVLNVIDAAGQGPRRQVYQVQAAPKAMTVHR